MDVSQLAIQYPVFVLKTGEQSFVTCDLSRAVPKRKIAMGIPVFTTADRAADHLRSLEFQATLKSYEQERIFRQFLRAFLEMKCLICFDPQVLGRGRVRVENAFPAGVVLERFTKDPGWGWQYPLYAIYHWGSYATLELTYSSRLCNVPMRMAIVLTDQDLADREIMSYHIAHGCVRVRILNAEEFADFVRRLPADVGGVIFDPPTQRGDHMTNRGTPRDELLQILSSRI